MAGQLARPVRPWRSVAGERDGGPEPGAGRQADAQSRQRQRSREGDSKDSLCRRSTSFHSESGSRRRVLRPAKGRTAACDKIDKTVERSYAMISNMSEYMSEFCKKGFISVSGIQR